jgi:hypothetical protein
VITLVWDALATAIEDVPSYENVLKRSQRYFQGVKYSKAFIKTKAGLQLYDERIRMLEICHKSLEYEDVFYCYSRRQLDEYYPDFFWRNLPPG